MSSLIATQERDETLSTTHCDTLQNTETKCNTLQHILQYTATEERRDANGIESRGQALLTPCNTEYRALQRTLKHALQHAVQHTQQQQSDGTFTLFSHADNATLTPCNMHCHALQHALPHAATYSTAHCHTQCNTHCNSRATER